MAVGLEGGPVPRLLVSVSLCRCRSFPGGDGRRFRLRGPVPTALRAATVNRYAFPLCNPVTSSDVAAELKVRLGCAVDPRNGVTT